MRLLTLIPVLLLAACAASTVPYKPAAAPANPEKVVERVLYESDSGLERVSATREFIEYADPAVRERRLVVLSETVQQPAKRVYYRSIAKVALYEKRGTWYVVPEGADGRELLVVRPTSEVEAKLLVDALTALR
jgi:hypothetical protein